MAPQVTEHTSITTNLKTIGLIIGLTAAAVTSYALIRSDISAVSNKANINASVISVQNQKIDRDHEILLEIRGILRAKFPDVSVPAPKPRPLAIPEDNNP